MTLKRKQEDRTTLVRKEDRRLNWFVLDASGQTLGRFCSEVAKILRGKHKVSFTPHVDMGDGVIIINAEKIRVTGRKEAQKIYRYYTGHIGGLRELPYRNLLANKPEYILRRAIGGMIPRTRLHPMRRLRIFKGEEHPYMAQQPIKVEL